MIEKFETSQDAEWFRVGIRAFYEWLAATYKKPCDHCGEGRRWSASVCPQEINEMLEQTFPGLRK